MSRLKLVPAILGGVLIFMGYQELKLANVAKDTAQAITCENLATKGPGDNSHVAVSDFLLCSFVSYVYTEKKGKWVDAWVPLVHRNSAYHTKIKGLVDKEGNLPDTVPAPKQIAIICKLNVDKEEEVYKFGDRDVLQGLIINEIESLDSETKQMLSSGYPGVDFGKCLILELDRKPMAIGAIYGMLGGGGVLFILGVLLLVGVWPNKKELPPSAPVEESPAEDAATAESSDD